MGTPYTPVTVTNYNLNPPPDDGSQTPANEITWAKSKTKLGDPLKTAIEAINTNLVSAIGKLAGGITSVSDDYQVLAADQGKTVVMTAAAKTITTPDATIVTAPFRFSVQNNSAGILTIDGSGAQTIDGAASIIIPPRSGTTIETDGSNWKTMGQNWSDDPWTSIVAASTTDLGAAASHNLLLTGSTTITGFGTVASGVRRRIRVQDAPLLTYNGTSLIIPGGGDLQLAPGYVFDVDSLGSGNWIVSNIQPPNWGSLAGYRNLSVSVTSATAWAITADSLTVTDAVGRAIALSSVSLTGAITTSGANGLDAGSEASGTWYSVWAIYNPATATVASLISTSATAPTLPSGYTMKARVGWIRNDGSSNLYRTLQKGRRAQYIVGTNPSTALRMANGTTTIFTALDVSSFVPPTASVIVGSLSVQDGSGSVAPNSSYGTDPHAATNQPMAGLSISSGTFYMIGYFQIFLESSNIYWGASNSNSGIYVSGWEDNL